MTQKTFFVTLAVMMLIALAIPFICKAAEPACYPGDASSSIPDFKTAVETKVIWKNVHFNTLGVAVVWFCDIDHTWIRQGLVERIEAVNTARIAALKVLASNYSREAMRAAWLGNMPGDTDIYTPGNPDNDLVPLYESIDPPDFAPPSGSIMKTNVVYAQKFKTDSGYTMQAVGSVTKVPFATVVCNYAEKLVDNGKTYYAIPRSAVTMKKIGNYTPPFPNTAYGECT